MRVSIKISNSILIFFWIFILKKWDKITCLKCNKDTLQSIGRIGHGFLFPPYVGCNLLAKYLNILSMNIFNSDDVVLVHSNQKVGK